MTCYECKKSSHIKTECPQLKKGIKKKKKALVVIWSDSEESSSNDEHQELANLCLTAHKDEVHSEHCLDFSINELYEAFNDLIDEHKALKRKNKE